MVHDDLGLMRVLAYIEANPVAAGLCKTPDDWPWSSYGSTVAGISNRVPDLDRLRAHIAPNGDLAGVYKALVSGALLAPA